MQWLPHDPVAEALCKIAAIGGVTFMHLLEVRARKWKGNSYKRQWGDSVDRIAGRPEEG